MTKSLQLILLLLFIVPLSCSEKPKEAPLSDKKIIIGYVPGFRGVLDQLSVDANKLTHINYAFVDVQDSMAWLTNMETDTVNFRLLNQLKEVNPDLKILISIGGWTWSGNFSEQDNGTMNSNNRNSWRDFVMNYILNIIMNPLSEGLDNGLVSGKYLVIYLIALIKVTGRKDFGYVAFFNHEFDCRNNHSV